MYVYIFYIESITEFPQSKAKIEVGDEEMEDAGGGGIGKMGDSWERESSQTDTRSFYDHFFVCKKTVDGGEQKLLEEPGAADGAGRSDAAPSSPAEWQLAVAVAVSLLRCVGSWLHSGFIRVACLVNNSSS